VHQTVEAMSIALTIDSQRDPEILQAHAKMRATLEDWIPKILAAQEPDGYLQTAFTLPRVNGRGGGVGSGETSEGFGPNYSLRNRAYCESCSSCGALFFQWKMDLACHDAKYADLHEETMYDALPGSTITLENVAGTDVEMVQATDYPWSGKLALTVKPAIEKGYAVITRVWKAGDTVDKVALRYGPLVYNYARTNRDKELPLEGSQPAQRPPTSVVWIRES
jgi:hypothetical protein